MNGFRYLYHNHRFALGIFGLALIAMLFFATRFAVHWVYWNDPLHQNQPIAGWMTPGYIAQSYGVEIDVIRAALDLTEDSPRRVPLDEIAQQHGLTRADLVAEIEAAIAAFRLSP